MDISLRVIVPLSMLLVKGTCNVALVFRIIEPVKEDFTKNTITLKQGTALEIECRHVLPDKYTFQIKPLWIRDGYTNYKVVPQKLTIKKLDVTDAGNYTCRFMEYSRSLKLEVLFPVIDLTITGPYTVQAGSPFTLSCSANSNPQPTFWWTMDPDPAAPKIIKDSLLTISRADRDEYWFYCFAQNTMVPTFESSKTTVVSGQRHVVITPKHEEAAITDLPEEYTAYAGSTLDIACSVSGTPITDVWWTKKWDEMFRRNGTRLIEKDVQLNFAGIYVCNAGNNIIFGEDTQQTFDTREVAIEVKELPKQDNSWAITSAISGWILVVAVVLGQILYRIRRKLTMPCRAVSNGKKESGIELSTIEGFGDDLGDDHTEDSPRSKLTVACQTVAPSRSVPRGAIQTARKENFMTILDSGAFGSYEKF